MCSRTLEDVLDTVYHDYLILVRDSCLVPNNGGTMVKFCGEIADKLLNFPDNSRKVESICYLEDYYHFINLELDKTLVNYPMFFNRYKKQLEKIKDTLLSTTCDSSKVIDEGNQIDIHSENVQNLDYQVNYPVFWQVVLW